MHELLEVLVSICLHRMYASGIYWRYNKLSAMTRKRKRISKRKSSTTLYNYTIPTSQHQV
jgi:hypothetical protein